jgi:WD40 repeat protein
VTTVATVLSGHEGRVTSASFSVDGKRVVTASDDNTARVWDLSDTKPVSTVLSGHQGWVYSASFSADGMRVVTASSDKTARVWDLSGAAPVSTVLSGHQDWITSASFSADGKRVVAASSDGTAIIHPVPADDELVALARRSITRCLTVNQMEALGLPVVQMMKEEGDRDLIRPPPC